VNPSNNYCYRVTVGGSILGSFNAGTTTVGAAYGNTNGYLYTTRTSTSRLYVRNPLTGSIYNSYNLSFTPADVGFDNRGYLWCAAPQQSRIYQLSPTGSVVNSFLVVPGTPYGCDFDGTTVWVGTVGTQHMVYRYEVGLGGAVEPASIGRVKAIYR
jgi:hypothetical protein